METLQSVSPRTGGKQGEGESPDEIAIRLAKNIEADLPQAFVYKQSDVPDSLEVFRN